MSYELLFLQLTNSYDLMFYLHNVLRMFVYNNVHCQYVITVYTHTLRAFLFAKSSIMSSKFSSRSCRLSMLNNVKSTSLSSAIDVLSLFLINFSFENERLIPQLSAISTNWKGVPESYICE